MVPHPWRKKSIDSFTEPRSFLGIFSVFYGQKSRLLLSQMLNNTTNLFSQESNLHSISVLYRFLRIAFNNPRLTNRVKTNMPRIIIPILTPIGVLTANLVLSVVVALFVEGVASVLVGISVTRGKPGSVTVSCTNIG